MVVCSRRFYILAKSTIFHGFSRNEALFATLFLKVHPNAERWWFAREGFTFWPNRRFFMVSRDEALFATFYWKVDPNGKTWQFARESCTFLPNRRFSMLSRKIKHFLQLLAEKLTQTPTHGGLLEKVACFGQIDDFSCFFAKLSTFCNFLLKSWPKRRNIVVCSKKLHIFPKLAIFHGFSPNRALFATFCLKVHPNAETWWFAREDFTFWPNQRFFMLFCEMRHFFKLSYEKLTQTPKHGGLLEKVASFGQIDDFSCFSAKWGTFCNFFLKSLPKHRNVVVCSRRFYTLAKSTIVHGLSRNEALFAIFCWEVDPNGKTW